MELPIVLQDYLHYISGVQNRSMLTAKEYQYDLVTFLKFMRLRKDRLPVAFGNVDISDVDIPFLQSITLPDLHAFLSFSKTAAAARFRKIAAIRSFYRYLVVTMQYFDDNPTERLEYPKLEQRLPIHLTLQEVHHLLSVLLSDDRTFMRVRDYAIIMIFLNCGLRLSELVSLNLNHIRDDDTMRVIGKGNKERVLFLNPATRSAIDLYLLQRPSGDDVVDTDALFLSQQLKRISRRAVQAMIERRISDAGFDPRKYTVHKLRHTAATLMYTYGSVDILAIKEVLGHENVSTTQIYTHLDTKTLRNATNQNPLSQYHPDENEM